MPSRACWRPATSDGAAGELPPHQPRLARCPLAALPLVIFAAPFIIMRNTIRARRIVARRFEFVMLATMLAGFWSLMSGTLVMMVLEAVGQFLT